MRRPSSIPSNKHSRFSQQIIHKNRRESKQPTAFSDKQVCFVVTHKSLRLIMSLIPLGNRSRLLQPRSSRVCKLCSSQMESGSCLIMQLSDRSRYPKCFKLPMEHGNTSKDELLRSSTRKYLNLAIHASSKDAGCSVLKIMVWTLLNFSNYVVTSCPFSKNDRCQTSTARVDFLVTIEHSPLAIKSAKSWTRSCILKV